MTGERIAENAFVFSDAGDCSTFWKADALGRRFVRVAEAVGLRGGAVGDRRLHDLRHTFVTWLCDQGLHIHDVQAAAGHDTLAVTQGYIHARQANPAVAAAMARAFEPGV
jgi:integrase